MRRKAGILIPLEGEAALAEARQVDRAALTRPAATSM
jgi:hypothetical protein